MWANKGISLGYSGFGDYIYASSYNEMVNIKDGQTFTYGYGTESNDVSGSDVPSDNLKGKYLFPAIDEITLKASSDGEGNYWTTFYCGHRNYTADASTTIYKGEVTENSVQLTAVTDIPAGNAVILKSTKPTITLTQTGMPSGDGDEFDNNDLHAVDVRTTTADIKTTLGNGTFYVMSNKNSHFGFHKYTGATMPVNKAFLLISGEALAREFFEFNEATAIVNVQRSMYNNQLYYDLQGRKLDNPKKGLYIVNGKKVVIN